MAKTTKRGYQEQLERGPACFVEMKCDEMVRAGNDSKKVFGLVKELAQKPSAISDVINDRNGSTLTESADIKTRWAEYCTELYEQNITEEPTNKDKEQLEFEPPPLVDEVRWTMNNIRNGKSPGYDEIPGELWKASCEEGIMWRLCDRIWRKVEWPKDWRRTVFIPIRKKRNIKECSNHRTISLISHASKILLKIINNRSNQIKFIP